MSTITSILKQYRLPIGIALSLMFVELMGELLYPLFLAKMIDDGIMQGDLSVIYKWGSIMIAMSLISFLCGVTNAFYASHVSQSTGYELRNRLYKKIQDFSFANLQRFPTSSLITRMTNDITQIQQMIYLSLGILMRAPLRVIGGTVMAFVVYPKLAMILALTLPILFAFLIWIKKKGFTLFSKVQTKLDRVNHVIRENLIAIRLIRLFVRREHEAKRFNKRNRALMDQTVTVLRIMEITMPVLLLLMNGAIIAILWFGSFEFHSGDAQIGQVVAIVNYVMRIASALTVFSMMIAVLSRAQASMERIDEVLDVEENGDGQTKPSIEKHNIEGIIEFEQVSFHYPKSKKFVLNDCSFVVEAGKRIAILGATGSGKTSLFQLIPRLYDASKGNIYIDHKNTSEINVTDLRNQIGYVPQEVLLFTGSVKGNIMWGKNDATMDEIIAAAKDAQIHETIMKLPQQYETKIGQKGVNLSGGQKQRIAIARALIRKPRILLLDDSTSALDMTTEANLLNALTDYQCTTLLITQKIDTAREADSIILLESGRIVAEGTHEHLLEMSPLYEQLYQSQYFKGDVIDEK